MGVAVADDLEVEVVGVPAAGEHGVQLLPGFLPGQQAVHGVGGDALGGVDGGGVTETGRGARRSPRAAGRLSWLRLCRTVRSPLRPTRVMVQRSPFLTQSVAESRRRRSLRAGDDHVADTRPVSVPQTHFLPGRGTVEAMIAGAAVELGDELAGRSEHDRVESDGSVGNPSSEGILGDLGEITDMNTAMIEIEAECARDRLPAGRARLVLRPGR